MDPGKVANYVTASLRNHLVIQVLYHFRLSGHDIIRKKKERNMIKGFLFSLVNYSGSMKVKEN